MVKQTHSAQKTGPPVLAEGKVERALRLVDVLLVAVDEHAVDAMVPASFLAVVDAAYISAFIGCVM